MSYEDHFLLKDLLPAYKEISEGLLKIYYDHRAETDTRVECFVSIPSLAKFLNTKNLISDDALSSITDFFSLTSRSDVSIDDFALAKSRVLNLI